MVEYIYDVPVNTNELKEFVNRNYRKNIEFLGTLTVNSTIMDKHIIDSIVATSNLLNILNKLNDIAYEFRHVELYMIKRELYDFIKRTYMENQGQYYDLFSEIGIELNYEMVKES